MRWWVINNTGSDMIAAAFGTAEQPRVYYFHFDGLGSVVALSDRDGRTVEVYRYDVFGRTAIYDLSGQTAVYDGAGRRLRPASAVGNPYFFTGRRLDVETGLYYYRARMYNPAIGRFLQTDPIGYADGINWYAYCGNNPVVFVDPYGLSFWTIFSGGLQAGGGILEAVAGGTVAFVTSPTIVGGVAGGAVCLHGIDTAQAGFRQLWTGKTVDTYTSKGMQAIGVPQQAANLVDAGIGIVGSAGAGTFNAKAKLSNMTPAGLIKYDRGSKALPNDVFRSLGGDSTTPFQKAARMAEGSVAGAGGFHPIKATELALRGTGLTPLADILGAPILGGFNSQVQLSRVPLI